MGNNYLYPRRNIMQTMKTKQILFTIVILFFIFSCSKKEEIKVSDFALEVNSDFLTTSQKAYYLFTNNKGEIILEGILENGKKYDMPLLGNEAIHFTYLISTPSTQSPTIIANTFLNIEVSSSLILHQALNAQSALANAEQPKGKAEVRTNCFGGTYYTTIATQSDALFSLTDNTYNNYPQYINLFGTQEEALAIRSTTYSPTSPNQFQYAIKNIGINQQNEFICTDFKDGKNVMKSIQVDVGRTRNIGKGDIILSVLPNEFISPNPIHSFGQIDKRNFDFSTSQTSTLWYMEDWIKSKREYINITTQTYERKSNNEIKRIYQQSNYGLYPPPSTLRLEIPITSIEITHNQNKSVITQEGEQSIGSIIYQRKGSRNINEKIYAWLLQFSGDEEKIDWIFPTLSSQMRSHLGIEEGVFEKEMIPIVKFMSIFDDYEGYTKFIQTTFQPYNFRLYKAPSEWKVDYDITEYLSNEGGIIVPYNVNILRENRVK